MKYETTNKAVKNGYSFVISLPYCSISYLTRATRPVAYTHGIYGWNSDIYEMEKYNACISTGYRPVSGFTPNYEEVEKYEHQAERIIYNGSDDWDIKDKKLKSLYNVFCEWRFSEYRKNNCLDKGVKK